MNEREQFLAYAYSSPGQTGDPTAQIAIEHVTHDEKQRRLSVQRGVINTSAPARHKGVSMTPVELNKSLRMSMQVHIGELSAQRLQTNDQRLRHNYAEQIRYLKNRVSRLERRTPRGSERYK